VVRASATDRLHGPKRPEWECIQCGRKWPCDAAREDLAVSTGGGSSLAVLMWALLEEFIRDTDAKEFAGIFERFIGWTRHL
jgi:hypothetical protein